MRVVVGLSIVAGYSWFALYGLVVSLGLYFFYHFLFFSSLMGFSRGWNFILVLLQCRRVLYRDCKGCVSFAIGLLFKAIYF